MDRLRRIYPKTKSSKPYLSLVPVGKPKFSIIIIKYVKENICITCSFPQSLHLSHPTQSIMRDMLRKCCLNSSFNFTALSPPENITVSLKWSGNELRQLKKSFFRNHVNLNLPRMNINSLYDTEQILHGCSDFSIVCFVAGVVFNFVQIRSSFSYRSHFQ